MNGGRPFGSGFGAAVLLRSERRFFRARHLVLLDAAVSRLLRLAAALFLCAFLDALPLLARAPPTLLRTRAAAFADIGVLHFLEFALDLL